MRVHGQTRLGAPEDDMATIDENSRWQHLSDPLLGMTRGSSTTNTSSDQRQQRRRQREPASTRPSVNSPITLKSDRDPAHTTWVLPTKHQVLLVGFSMGFILLLLCVSPKRALSVLQQRDKLQARALSELQADFEDIRKDLPEAGLIPGVTDMAAPLGEVVVGLGNLVTLLDIDIPFVLQSSSLTSCSKLDELGVSISDARGVLKETSAAMDRAMEHTAKAVISAREYNKTLHDAAFLATTEIMSSVVGKPDIKGWIGPGAKVKRPPGPPLDVKGFERFLPKVEELEVAMANAAQKLGIIRPDLAGTAKLIKQRRGGDCKDISTKVLNRWKGLARKWKTF